MTDNVAGLVERLGKMAEALDAYSTFLLANDLDMHPECPEADPEEMAKDAREAAAEIARLRGALLSGRERAIAARNFLAINAPSHADRHLAEAIADYTREVPEIVQAHDDTIRAAIAQQGGDDGQN